MRKTDLKCIEPERWPTSPASDATDEEIERYLAHVENCPFHAALEQDEAEAIQRTVEAARSLSESGELPLGTDEEAGLVDNLERYVDFKTGEKRIKAVLLRGRSIEDKLLDLSQRRDQISFNVPAPCSIQVLAPVGDSGQELLIATHVINATSQRGVGPVRSSLNLPGNRSLSFETRQLEGNWCQVAITVGKLHKFALAERLGLVSLMSLLRKPIPRAITVIVALILIGSLGVWYYQRKGNTPTTLVQTQPTSNPGEREDNSNKQSITGSQNESTPPLQVALNDGGRVIGLDQNGKLLGLQPELPSPYQRSIENMLRTGEVPVASLPQGLRGGTEGRMGAGPETPEFYLISPIKKVVLTPTPKFDWGDLAGAASYNVKVFNDHYKFIVESGPLQTSSWTVPPGEALEPGKVYVWEVMAVKDGEEISSTKPAMTRGRQRINQAWFKVLESSRALEIERAKAAYGNSHVLMGMLYAQSGLLDEAEKEFQALLNANPESKLARKLLSDLKARRR